MEQLTEGKTTQEAPRPTRTLPKGTAEQKQTSIRRTTEKKKDKHETTNNEQQNNIQKEAKETWRIKTTKL